MTSNVQSNSNDRPLVSVVIRTYGNRYELLARAIASVVNQTYRPIEVVVVEDGGDLAEPTVRSIDGHDLMIRYFSLPKVGRCVSGNHGLEKSTGEWILFLDDDDEFYPDHVERLMEAVQGDPQAIAAYAWAEVRPTEIESLVPLTLHEKPTVLYPHFPFHLSLLMTQNLFPIQAVLFQRRLIEEFGGFHVDFELLEDWVLWCKLFRNGTVVEVPLVTSFFRLPANPEQRRTREQFYLTAKDSVTDYVRQLDVDVSRVQLKEDCEYRYDELRKRLKFVGWLFPRSNDRRFARYPIWRIFEPIVEGIIWFCGGIRTMAFASCSTERQTALLSNIEQLSREERLRMTGGELVWLTEPATKLFYGAPYLAMLAIIFVRKKIRSVLSCCSGRR